MPAMDGIKVSESDFIAVVAERGGLQSSQYLPSWHSPNKFVDLV